MATQPSPTNINVAIRIRPPLRDLHSPSPFKLTHEKTLTDISRGISYTFDEVFPPTSSNAVVFERVALPIVDAALEGFNGTVFAYGQTASGKTFTMQGTPEDGGICVRAAEEIFRQVERHPHREIDVSASYIEVYNEKLFDLARRPGSSARIHLMEALTGGVELRGAQEITMRSVRDLKAYLKSCEAARHIGGTLMNERSSRSHTILRLRVRNRPKEVDSGEELIGDLHLVDLAGSEGLSRTQAEGVTKLEGSMINQSLLALTKVIGQIQQQQERLSSDRTGPGPVGFVSYRDSKLTRLLADSLGGNSRTAIVCCISPETADYREAVSSLEFAGRAKCIKNRVCVNRVTVAAESPEHLKKEIIRLRRENRELLDRMARSTITGPPPAPGPGLPVHRSTGMPRTERPPVGGSSALRRHTLTTRRRRTAARLSICEYPSLDDFNEREPDLLSSDKENEAVAEMEPALTARSLDVRHTLDEKEDSAHDAADSVPDTTGAVPEDAGPVPEIDTSSEEDVAELYEQIKRLQSQLVENDEANVKVVNAMHETELALRASVERLSSELTTKSALLDKLSFADESAALLTAQVETATVRIASLEAELRTVRMQFERSEADLMAAQTQLELQRKQNDEIISRLTNEKKSSADLLKSLQAQQMAEKDQRVRDLISLDESRRAMEKELAAVQSDANARQVSLLTDKARLEEELFAVHETAASLDEKVRFLHNLRVQDLHDVITCRANVESIEKQLRELEAENRRLKSSLTWREAALESAHDIIDELLNSLERSTVERLSIWRCAPALFGNIASTAFLTMSSEWIRTIELFQDFDDVHFEEDGHADDVDNLATCISAPLDLLFESTCRAIELADLENQAMDLIHSLRDCYYKERATCRGHQENIEASKLEVSTLRRRVAMLQHHTIDSNTVSHKYTRKRCRAIDTADLIEKLDEVPELIASAGEDVAGDREPTPAAATTSSEKIHQKNGSEPAGVPTQASDAPTSVNENEWETKYTALAAENEKLRSSVRAMELEAHKRTAVNELIDQYAAEKRQLQVQVQVLTEQVHCGKTQVQQLEDQVRQLLAAQAAMELKQSTVKRPAGIRNLVRKP